MVKEDYLKETKKVLGDAKITVLETGSAFIVQGVNGETFKIKFRPECDNKEKTTALIKTVCGRYSNSNSEPIIRLVHTLFALQKKYDKKYDTVVWDYQL